MKNKNIKKSISQESKKDIYTFEDKNNIINDTNLIKGDEILSNKNDKKDDKNISNNDNEIIGGKNNKNTNILNILNKDFNKSNTLKINFSNIKKEKVSCIDERGFIVSENWSFYDHDGAYFNSED